MAAPRASIDDDPQHVFARALRVFDRTLDRALGAAANPLRQLGALAMLSFWLSVASGAWIYIFFDTAADGALRSVQALEASAINGPVKSLHRYASFAFIALSLAHLGYEWGRGRYRGVRWFTWVTGLPLLWLSVACGMVGYWLVADLRAQYVAAAIGEWVGVLPGVGDAVMRNFVTAEAVSDRLFSLLIFLHIGIGLVLLAGIWVHLTRLVRPATWPQRAAGIGHAGALLLLCLLLPALAAAPANFARVASPVPVDWLAYGVLPLAHNAPRAVWALLLALTFLLAMLPWLPARTWRKPAAAAVDPANCNGCRRCFDDCPFGAVLMVAHPDKRHREMARVLADQCVACGICVGACPSSTPFRTVQELVTGIDLPQRPLDALREALRTALEQRGRPTAPVLLIGCDHGADVARAAHDEDVIALSLPCSAALPPAFVQYAQRQGAGRVLVADCGEHGCLYRFGARFTRERLRGEREPHLREQARGVVECIAVARGEEAKLAAAIARARMECSHV